MSKATERITAFFERHKTLYACVRQAEDAVKKPLFGCKSCGQCVLSYNAFVCCMRCPKQIRNGPCGGTRENGTCEVYPDRPCIWHLIYRRAKRLGWWRKLRKYHKPVDSRLQDTSAWLNMFAGRILKLGFKKDLDPGDE
jgi:hypothetical protein